VKKNQKIKPVLANKEQVRLISDILNFCVCIMYYCSWKRNILFINLQFFH